MQSTDEEPEKQIGLKSGRDHSEDHTIAKNGTIDMSADTQGNGSAQPDGDVDPLDAFMTSMLGDIEYTPVVSDVECTTVQHGSLF